MMQHIGDGVYVEWDGFHLVLAANSPNSENKIYLEDWVYEALVEYMNDALGKNKPKDSIEEI